MSVDPANPAYTHSLCSCVGLALAILQSFVTAVLKRALSRRRMALRHALLPFEIPFIAFDGRLNWKSYLHRLLEDF